MNPTNRSTRIKPRPEKAPLEEPKTKGQIVGGWFHEEGFYRDVATRFIAGSAVALLAYLGAVGLGYVSKPPAFAVLVLLAGLVYVPTQLLAAYCLFKKRYWRTLASWLTSLSLTCATMWLGLKFWVTNPEGFDKQGPWFWTVLLSVPMIGGIAMVIMRRRIK
ncbi:hypothetical protein HZU40_23705 [Mycolicibacterium fluoranthenivorans]|uniref:Uncharacterized protein n=1 Tax=Mycolicibacterium fluoranthenivorans TaxID=258505 RepID=A0A7G8PA36_9MYCO|nr:hypothetical protein [Mycolicibacterium fluoranthenivorans]QNJ91202.1 hypothetical protein HZU40_23705 [Mycolicibacterium fluoranthenivorans]